MYCHLNVKTGTRTTGQSAAAKYDYISRDGRYARACQDEVVHIESGSMPAFASSDARVYWAAADSHERSNGRLFRSLTAALPNSLDLAGRLELARSFAEHVTAGQMPYTLAVHAGLSKEPGAAEQPAPAPGVLRAGERRGGAGGGAVVPAGGAGGPGPGVRGREEERAHEAAGVAAGDAASVGGGNEPGVRPGRRGGPGDGREPRRATGAGARGRRRGGRAAPSAQPAVRAHRAGGEAPLGGEVARAEAGPVCRVRAGVGCCPGGRLAHARDAAEAAEARRRIETLDVKIAALEAEQRRAEAAARRRKEAAARREAEKRRDEAKWKATAKDREAALGLLPGGVELYLAHLADIDPKWNVNDNHATTRENVDAALGAAESDARRLERLRGVLTDEAAAARYRQQLGKGAGRAGTADLDEALAPAEALRRRVSRLRELFAAPGGDAALFTALEDRSPSWPRTGDSDRHRAGAGCRRAEPGPPAGGQLGTPGGPRGGTAVPGCPERGVATNGRALRRVHRYRPPGQARHADALGSRPRACHRRRAARAAGPARIGEAALRVAAGARSEDAAQASPVESRASSGSQREGGGVEPARAAAAEQARQERRQARKLITAARAAARKWGDIPLATGTAVSVAESISARPGMSAAHRAVLEQIREAAPRSSLSTEAAALRRRCLGEKDAAADQRHQQALGEWEAQSWTRRRMAGRPRREHPDPPNRHDLAAARDELAGVVRSAMITELEKLMPQRRPASPPADGARTPPAKAAARRDQHQVERPAEGQRQDSGPHPGHAAQAGAGPAPGSARPRT